MKTRLIIIFAAVVFAGGMIFGHGARSQVATLTPTPALHAGDALIKMVLGDGTQRVRNQVIPVTPNSAMGWDGDGNPAALPMPTTFRAHVGTPTPTTPGTDGDVWVDSNYFYSFLAGSWSKSPRYNLTPQ